MKVRNINFVMALLRLACAGFTSCQSKQPSPASGMFSSSPPVAAAANDYTKPYLTDEKINKFIASMKEDHNPFELLFKAGGRMQNPLDLASRLEEFNCFGRKYGFRDYQDYSAVWGRIVAGEVQLWGNEMNEGKCPNVSEDDQ